MIFASLIENQRHGNSKAKFRIEWFYMIYIVPRRTRFEIKQVT